MDTLSRKICLTLPSAEADCRSDRQRLLETLAPEFGLVDMPLILLRQLYPMCREGAITVTLVWRGDHYQMIDLEAGDTTGWHYALAADLGSTTVTVELVDLNTGEPVGRESMFNLQIPMGEDVLARIFYAKEDPAHLSELRWAAVDTINQLLERLAASTGVDVSRCAVMALAGNTVMTHLLLGLDGYPLFSAPYVPVTTQVGFVPAADLGLSVLGLVYIYPARANYIGGDVISGLVAMGLARSENIRLFFDIGTNGELVAGCRDFLLSGAGAAGPALEGGVIRTGMCAGPGAVDHVVVRGDEVVLSVIGGGKVKGLCGSGIVDLLAELFMENVVDFRGEFRPERSNRLVWTEEGEYAYCYADAAQTEDGQPLLLYQGDIDRFLRAKAAAYAMVEHMLLTMGLTLDDVEAFYLAGAFGEYVSVSSAVAIGLYPELSEEKLVRAGNTSLAGCRALLLDRGLLEEIREILEKMDYMQYGAIADFLQSMEAAQAIPHLEVERFPSVLQRWEERRLMEF